MAPGLLAALLRSAVALQAEGLVRTAGALSGTLGRVVDNAGWVERDAKDLCALTAAAVAAGASLPAGMDTGTEDSDSILEGLRAHNEVLVSVLRQLADTSATGPASVEQGGERVDVDGCGPEQPWQGLVRAVLQRREEEMALLRAAGATGHVPAEPIYRRGQPPRHF